VTVQSSGAIPTAGQQRDFIGLHPGWPPAAFEVNAAELAVGHLVILPYPRFSGETGQGSEAGKVFNVLPSISP
jgi:hypothetical protein